MQSRRIWHLAEPAKPAVHPHQIASLVSVCGLAATLSRADAPGLQLDYILRIVTESQTVATPFA